MTSKKTKVNINRIDKLFNSPKKEKIVSPFITAGYPDLQSTAKLIAGMAENGADMIELGMSYSDPLADGPTIQFASTKALENGITMNRIFEDIVEARKQTDIPILLMGYLNPVLQYGVARFCQDVQQAGVDGLIIPDLPPEESTILEEAALSNRLKLIFLVAPNTSDERMRMIDNKSSGFVYCVSVTGVTGARQGSEVADSVNRFIERVRQNVTKNPVLIGFGIKSHDDAQKIAHHTDGFIVGSALINTIKEHYPNGGWEEKVFEFVKHLKYGD